MSKSNYKVTLESFKKDWTSQEATSKTAQSITGGMMNPDTVEVHIHHDGGYLEKLKDGRYYCQLERDDCISEKLEAVQAYLWEWVKDQYDYEEKS